MYYITEKGRGKTKKKGKLAAQELTGQEYRTARWGSCIGRQTAQGQGRLAANEWKEGAKRLRRWKQG